MLQLESPIKRAIGRVFPIRAGEDRDQKPPLFGSPPEEEPQPQPEQDEPPRRDTGSWKINTSVGRGAATPTPSRLQPRAEEIVNRVLPPEQFKEQEQGVWSKVWSVIERPVHTLSKGVKHYERWVQDPVLGILSALESPEGQTNLMYDAVRRQQKGTPFDSWIAWGKAFDMAEDIDPGTKLGMRVVSDPLNLVGWGLLGKMPGLAGRVGAAVDKAFLKMADVPIFLGGKAVKGVTAPVWYPIKKYGIIPPTITRMKASAKAFTTAKGQFRAALVKFSGKGEAYYAGTAADTAALVQKVRGRTTFHNAPKPLRVMNDLMIEASVPTPGMIRRTPAVKEATESWGVNADRASAEVYSILAQHGKKAGAFANDENTLKSIMFAVGGANNTKAAKFAEGILKRARSRFTELGDQLEKMAPPLANTTMASRIAEATGGFAVAEKMAAAQGRTSAILNAIDPIESVFFRQIVDGWVSRPFAESYLGFSCYAFGNAVEEIVRGLLSGGGVRWTWPKEIMDIWGDTPYAQYLMELGGMDVTLAGSIGTKGLSKETFDEAFKYAQENAADFVRGRGLAEKWPEAQIEKEITKAVGKMRASGKKGIVEIGTPFGPIKMGDAQSLKNLGERLTGVPKGVPLLKATEITWSNIPSKTQATIQSLIKELPQGVAEKIKEVRLEPLIEKHMLATTAAKGQIGIGSGAAITAPTFYHEVGHIVQNSTLLAKAETAWGSTVGLDPAEALSEAFALWVHNSEKFGITKLSKRSLDYLGSQERFAEAAPRLKAMFEEAFPKAPKISAEIPLAPVKLPTMKEEVKVLYQRVLNKLPRDIRNDIDNIVRVKEVTFPSERSGSVTEMLSGKDVEILLEKGSLTMEEDLLHEILVARLIKHPELVKGDSILAIDNTARSMAEKLKTATETLEVEVVKKPSPIQKAKEWLAENYLNGETWLSLRPRASATKAGAITFLPGGTFGEFTGKSFIRISAALASFRRGTWMNFAEEELAKAYMKIPNKEAVDELIVMAEKLADDPILQGTDFASKELPAIIKRIQSTISSKYLSPKQAVEAMTSQRLQARKLDDIIKRHPSVPAGVRYQARALAKGGKPPQEIADWVVKDGIQNARDNFLYHPAVMVERIGEMETMLTTASLASKEAVYGALDNFNTMLYTTALMPHEVRRVAYHQAIESGAGSMRDAIWRQVDDELVRYENAVSPAMDRISALIEKAAEKQGIRGVTKATAKSRDIISRTKEVVSETSSFREIHFKQKGTMPADQFWGEYYRGMDEIWAPYHIAQAGDSGELISMLHNLTGRGRRRSASTGLHVEGEPSVDQLATILGGESSDLTRAVSEHVAMLSEDSFTEYVMRFLQGMDERFRPIGVTEEGVRKLHKKLLKGRGGADSFANTLMSPVVADMEGFAAELKSLQVAHGTSETIVNHLRSRVDEIETKLVQLRKDKPGLTDKLEDARQTAAKNATARLDREFTPYHDPSEADMFMKHIFPFWTYEANRWRWLPQHMIQYPALATQSGRYLGNTDYGYVRVQDDVQINPLRGTIATSLSTLSKMDFPEAYSGPAFEAIDWMGRWGFYPAAPFTFLMNYIGKGQTQHSEWGSMLPPVYDTALSMLVGMGNKPAAQVMEKFFPTRFKRYYYDQELERTSGVRLSDLEAEMAEIEADPAGNTERLEELKGMRHAAVQTVAHFNIMAIQSAMIRMRPKEREEAEAMRVELGASILPISKEEFIRLEKEYLNPFMVYSNYVDPELWGLLQHGFPGKYGGIGSELTTREPEVGILKRRQAARRKIDQGKEIRYQNINEIWGQWLADEKYTNQTRREAISVVYDGYRSTMDKLFGVKEWKEVDGVLTQVRKGATADEQYGEYGWRFKDGKYLGGIPMSWQEMLEYYKWTGRIDTLAPPHELEVLLDAMYSLNPYSVLLPNGTPDWDWHLQEMAKIDSYVPEHQREIWDRMTVRGTPVPEEIAKQYRNTVLKPYWEVHDKVLNALSYEDKKVVRDWMSTNVEGRRKLLQGTTAVKDFSKQRTEMRAAMRRGDPVLDYMLWWLGYTDGGVDGAEYPKKWYEWGKQPPQLEDPSKWAQTYEQRAEEQRQLAAEKRGFEWYTAPK